MQRKIIRRWQRARAVVVLTYLFPARAGRGGVDMPRLPRAHAISSLPPGVARQVLQNSYAAGALYAAGAVVGAGKGRRPVAVLRDACA